jgi:hypothetical protein
MYTFSLRSPKFPEFEYPKSGVKKTKKQIPVVYCARIFTDWRWSVKDNLQLISGMGKLTTRSW